MRVLTLGCDASWGGWGLCGADQDGPLQTAHVALGPPRKRARPSKRNPNPEQVSTYRLQRLVQLLQGPVAYMLTDLELLRRPTDPPVRVVIEVPPVAFKGGKASAYVQVGRLVGSLELWACRRHTATPWVLEPGEWRPWWGIRPTCRGRGRDKLKAEAIWHVGRHWSPDWLEPYRDSGKTRGPRGDVAEAILQAVGAARHPGLAPATPADWPAPKAVQVHQRGELIHSGK